MSRRIHSQARQYPLIEGPGMVEKRDFMVTSFQVSFEDLGDRSSMIGSSANDNLAYFVSRH